MMMMRDNAYAMISSFHAAVLGFVEGLTEFLPVSSTGHLILTSHWLGLGYSEGVKSFEVVIQFGALLAVVGLYFPSIRAMLRGLLGRDPEGRDLLVQLIVAFLPAAVVGGLAQGWIKRMLFGPWPVVFALALGGLAMIVVERRQRLVRAGGTGAGTGAGGRTLADMTLDSAFLIGCAQVLAMWPGTSRSMITILAALLLGFTARDAAKFSFLLALPTLAAATANDLVKDGGAIMSATHVSGLAIGFVVSFVVAVVAVKGFITYLTRHGMTIFGWYRLAIALVMAWALLTQITLTGTIRSGANPATVLIETAQGSDQIFQNPVGQDLLKLTGHRVKLSGSMERSGGGGDKTIKVLSFEDLDRKKKEQ